MKVLLSPFIFVFFICVQILAAAWFILKAVIKSPVTLCIYMDKRRHKEYMNGN